MFISAKTVNGDCIYFNVSHIFLVTEDKKKHNAIVLTVDGDSFKLVESYEDFCQRLEQGFIKTLCLEK